MEKTNSENLQHLDAKLQKVGDETTKKLTIKEFLSYHFETGEALNYRRSVAICNSKFCDKQGKGCPMKQSFRDYLFCVS